MAIDSKYLRSTMIKRMERNFYISHFVFSAGLFYWQELALISAWISNHIPNKLWNEITYPFPNFNGATVEVCEWIKMSSQPL